MLDMNEIDQAIAELEVGKTSFSSCAKLAVLYAVRDHARGQEPVQYETYNRGYSQAPAPVSVPFDIYDNRSDFLIAASRKDTAAVMEIMDELMNNLEVVNPRVYESVLRKIENL